jgi:preprotein translocase subunit SecB
LRTERRARRERDTQQPLARVPRVKVLFRSDDGKAFRLAVTARVRVPVDAAEIWIAELVLEGRFAASIDLSPDLVGSFARQSGVFLLWPYARVILDQLALSAGVTVPPLPLLLRPGGQALEPPARQD